MSRIMKLNSKEWHYITLGCLAALIEGSVQPIFALVFGIMLGVSFQLESLSFMTRWLMYKVFQCLNCIIFSCV